MSLTMDEKNLNKINDECIAIPIKVPKEGEPLKIVPVFGKVKYFAIYKKNSKKIDTVKNSANNGRDVIMFLKGLNVKEIITLHMGWGAYVHASNQEMKVYFAGEEKQTVESLIAKLEANELVLINDQNFDILSKFSHGEHHHHAHD